MGRTPPQARASHDWRYEHSGRGHPAERRRTGRPCRRASRRNVRSERRASRNGSGFAPLSRVQLRALQAAADPDLSRWRRRGARCRQPVVRDQEARAHRVPDEVVGRGLSRSLPGNAASIATWLDARNRDRGGDLTRKRLDPSPPCEPKLARPTGVLHPGPGLSVLAGCPPRCP